MKALLLILNMSVATVYVVCNLMILQDINEIERKINIILRTVKPAPWEGESDD